jgi:hypothetical protein
MQKGEKSFFIVVQYGAKFVLFLHHIRILRFSEFFAFFFLYGIVIPLVSGESVVSTQVYLVDELHYTPALASRLSNCDPIL